eukprot:CAMPEP_0185776292 /NCGR_PEP_ID=MMETSP1174-20130828/85122_1 /TAXON_ID=35687 /ORGANISM="Dictyocha speculum, Strain CCMP1381" /LENGTH=137 /DNA_ID=CAMNT_0028464179 /DNA_START=313 /DNA_END=726 /DNA_ORIENTATION=+
MMHQKVTLVALSFKQFGFEQLSSWVDPFAEHAKKMDNSENVTSHQVAFLSVIDQGFISNLLRGSVLNGLKRSLPDEFHATSLLHLGDTDKICQELELSNRIIGHALLVDQKGRIRWRGCATAEEGEIDSLLRCADRL